MAVKILVLISILFLIGGTALVTYFTLSPETPVKKGHAEISKLLYTPKSEFDNLYSIKQIDSLTAADNYWFTKPGALNRPQNDL